MLMKTIQNTLVEQSSDVAAFRLHVLIYYYKYGLQPTLDAFSMKKSSLYNWKERYEKSGKKIISLVPESTRPHQTRKMTTDYRLVEFIKAMRETYGNVGKEMIKPFLDEYAGELGIESLSQTTIGKVIKRRQLTFEPVVKAKRKNKFAKLRVRKHPKVKQPGYIQMDSVIVSVDYEKHVFMCVIDIFTKFAVVEKVPSTASIHAREVFKKFQPKTPTPIHTVQTDNGSEFMKYFHAYLEEQQLTHVFIYPHSPKINGVVERFNRTIKQEFMSRHDEIYYDEQALRIKLDKYLYWYNYQRPHAALGYLSPMTFIQNKIPISR